MATSPESGEFAGIATATGVEALTERFNRLRSRGGGYFELQSPAGEFPLLSLGFRGDHAVIQMLSGPERSSLLAGDGSVPPDAPVTVAFMEGTALYTGEFVMSVDRAWELVLTFIRTGAAEELGEWYDL